MLADAGGGAEAAEHEAQQHKAADDVVPDAFQRDKRAAEHLREVGRILGIPAAECIVRAADDAGRNASRNQAGGDALDKERKADETVGRADELHNADLLAAVKDGDFDRVVDDDDGDDGQHRDQSVAGVVDDLLQGREGIRHSQRGLDAVNAVDLHELGGDFLNVVGVVHGHAVVGSERVVIGKDLLQVCVILQHIAVGRQNVLRRHIGHAHNVGCVADGRVGGGNLLVGGDLALAGAAHVDDGQVLVADVFDHVVNVDAQQRGCADQQHADGQHAHGGKGHQPVGAQVVQALADQVDKTGKTHGVPSYLQINPRRTRSHPLRARPWRQRSGARQQGQRCRRLPCRWPA